jgi:rhodanese-related sulfurtransferase
LKEKGIENAYALVGGTNAWKTAGYPMEGEAKPNPNPSKTDKN